MAGRPQIVALLWDMDIDRGLVHRDGRPLTEAQETQFILERGLELLSTVISAE